MARNFDRLRAKQLYIEETKGVKEIAALLGVPEKTIYRWRDDAKGTPEDWDKDREIVQLTPLAASKRMLILAIKKLDEMVATGSFDSKSADAFAKTVKSVRTLQKDVDIPGNILLGMNEFIEYLREHHPDRLEGIEDLVIEFGSAVRKKYL
jgi:transposase-like protein